MDYFEAYRSRRSYYAIGSGSPISDQRIEEIVKDAVAHVPSGMDSKSSRSVLLLGESHAKLWSIVMETLRKIVPEKDFSKTREKINSFAAGHGTVLYFEDQDVVEGLQKKFPLYADNFPGWSLQSSGMLQIVLWVALEAEGLGASLQHYNPLIDEEVKKVFDLPKSWKLLSQMPFGEILEEPEAKDKTLEEGRVRVFK